MLETEELTPVADHQNSWVDGVLGKVQGDTITAPLTSFAADLSQITAAIQNLEGRYTARFEQAMGEIRDSVRAEVRKELRKEYDIELHRAIEIAKVELDRRLERAASEWSEERTRLTGQLTELRGFAGKLDELRTEVLRADRDLAATTSELQRMIDDADVELSDLIRKKADNTELIHYLRGLRFLIPQ